MARTPEGAVKAQVIKQLKELGVYYFSPVTGGYGRSGVPDIVGCINGRFFAVECKAGKGVTTALQDLNIKQIKDNGGYAAVINETNVSALSTYLKMWSSLHGN